MTINNRKGANSRWTRSMGKETKHAKVCTFLEGGVDTDSEELLQCPCPQRGHVRCLVTGSPQRHSFPSVAVGHEGCLCSK